MNKREQQLFLSFFEELHQSEQLIDRLKIDLSLLEGFNPHLLFDLISQGNDVITIQQMRFFLTERMACNQRELYEVFEKFDWCRNGHICREDFIRELSPFGRPPLTFNHRQGTINTQIQGAFVALFLEILKRFRIVDVSRKEIAFIQPYDGFAHLDYWKKGIIGLGELQKFYRDNDFEVSERQLYFLLHALRRRCYRDVNLQVFCEDLNPLQFGQYLKFGQQMDKTKEKEFLNRSRLEDQAIRRSRIDNQKLQHQIQRAQRRKQAEVQRQLNLQERINFQLLDYDRKQELNIRRALLEEQRNIRSNAVLNNQILQRQQQRTTEESRRVNELESLIRKQRLVNEELKKSVFRNEAQLAASRRQAILDKQIALQQQVEREREAQRVISRAKNIELSKRELQINAIRERQSRLRDIQLQRLGESRPNVDLARSVKQSRITQLEKELDQTRIQMRERRSRLELQDKLRMEQEYLRRNKLNGLQY